MSAADSTPGIRERPSVRERLAFDVQGEAETGPLTWAQMHMMALIEAMQPQTASLNLKFTFPLRPGLRTADVLAAIRDLVETYEALRTLYVPPPEGPAQRCVQSGELGVDILEAAQEAVRATAEEAAQALGALPFEITSELPVRVAVVCAEGEPRCLAFAVSHLVVDFDGAYWMKYHFRDFSERPLTVVKSPATVHQPRHEAQWERSPAGQRAAQRACAQHEQAFRTAPQTMLPRVVADPGGPRYRYVTLCSPALATVVPALAARHRVSTTAVLYAAVAGVTGYVSGLPRALLQLTVGNRIEERTRCAVGMFTEDVPGVVDLAGASTSDVIERAGVAVLQAARFGRYPPARVNTTRAAAELERGISLDLTCWLNHQWRSGVAPVPAEMPGERELAGLMERTTWEWGGSDESSTCTYFIYANELAGLVTLTMLFDAALVPPPEGLAWLRSMESLLCAAATRDVPMASAGEYISAEPTVFGADWCLADCTRVHVPSVAELVRASAGAQAADVFAVPGEAGPRLVAYLAGPACPPVPQLHARCVGALPGMRTVMAPHSYVVCESPPARRDLDGWRHCTVIEEGSGRPAPR